jgi:hypothetical protein
MPFSTRMTRFPGYVQVDVAGPASIKDFVEVINTVAADTVYWSDRRLLVDLRAIEGRLNTEEQVFLGELVAHNLSHLDRMASVVPTEQITHNSERAAQKLGTQLRVFDNEAEAIAWLSADAAAPAAASGNAA